MSQPDARRAAMRTGADMARQAGLHPITASRVGQWWAEARWTPRYQPNAAELARIDEIGLWGAPSAVRCTARALSMTLAQVIGLTAR